MSAGAPWSVKGIDPKAREIAKDLARRSGMTLGEWLNQMILEDPEDDGVVTPIGRRPTGEAERRARLRRTDDAEADLGLERVSRALENLTVRIETAERRSSQAIGGVDQAVAGLLARLETSEVGQAGAAQKIEAVAAHLRAEQARLADRLRRVETEAAGPRSVEAVRALEAAMGKLAGQMAASDQRTRADVAAMGRRVAGLEAAPAESAIVFDGLVARISARLEEAEARTSNAIRSLEGSFSHLDERLGLAEARIGSERDTRFEQLAEDLSARVDQARAELLAQLDSAASDGRFDRVERALGELNSQVEITEKRSAQAIEHMGREVVRIARNLDTRMTGVEQTAARGVAETRHEMGRIAEAVEQRFRRGEEGHAQALEKLGQEIGRISEKMSERIAAAEQRAAAAAEDAGQRMVQTADQMETRWNRASSELADRIRASEERTAKLLDEAREKIDRTLARAEAPAPVAAATAPIAEPIYAERVEETMAAHESLFDEPTPAFGHRRGATPTTPPTWPAPTAAARHPQDDDGLVDEAPDFHDDFTGETEFLTEAELAETEPLTTREAIEAARAAARLGSRPAQEPERNFGFALGGLKLGAKTRLHERVARETKRDASLAKTVFTSSAVAASLVTAVVGYKWILSEPTKGPTPAKKPSKDPLKITEPDETPIAATAQTSLSNPTGQLASGPPTPAQKAAQDDDLPPLTITPDEPKPARAPAINATPKPDLATNRGLNAATPGAAKDSRVGDLYQEAVRRLDAQETGGVPLLQRAAELGYAPAEFYLGKLYENGESGVAKNPILARQWTERAAAAGERRAMHNLALFYFDGIGGQKDLIQAAAWFRKAADLGLVDSQYNLGRLYEQGFGVQRDLIQAYKWYTIAAKAGDSESKAAAEQLKAGLPAPDLKAAERAAADFHPGREEASRVAAR
jgi:localization factor PodJL